MKRKVNTSDQVVEGYDRQIRKTTLKSNKSNKKIRKQI